MGHAGVEGLLAVLGVSRLGALVFGVEASVCRNESGGRGSGVQRL